MKLTTSTILAASLLAGSILVNAQSQPTNNYDDQARPQSMSTSTMNAVGDDFHPMIGTAGASDSDQRKQEDTLKQKDEQKAPDYSKNPFWEPKDWHYIESTTGGGGD